MGINAGAFLGILLCGYIGEKVSWSYGFGLAGIFMLLGMLQFWFGQSILGDIGLKPKQPVVDKAISAKSTTTSNSSRIGTWAVVGVVIAALIYFLIPDVESNSILTVINKKYMPAIVFGIVIPFVGYIVTDPTLTKVEKDRVWVIVILTFFTVFFWWAFEQAGGSMTVFANDYTDRTLEGSSGTIFNSINALLTVLSLIHI